MMDTLTAARAMAATLAGPNVWFSGVATDSRSINAGELFVALQGERFDGHDYVAQAFERGAVAAIVAKDRLSQLGARRNGSSRSLLAVSDPLKALGALASFWRRRFRLPVAAITGSNGKTTVKEMTAAILRAAFGEDQALATLGNLNNDIGLPLTVLRLRENQHAAVIEIGMNHPGETGQLAAILQPTIGLINNAQREHQEFMKSVADVAAEHAAVLDALPDHGVAIINADDDFADFWRDVIRRRSAEGVSLSLRDFGLLAPAAVSATYRTGSEGSIVDVVTPEGSVHFELKALGRHNVANALAAIAAATAAGAGLGAVAGGFATYRPIAGRLQLKSALAGASVIDDTYNANPDSVRAAIAVLVRAASPTWLVLGDMGEVGDQGVAFHREVGEYARAAGVQRVLTIGELAAHTIAAFGEGGEHFPNIETLIASVRSGLMPGVTVLVKGSRFMRMERVVAALTGNAPEPH